MSDRALLKHECAALLESARSNPRDYTLLAFCRMTGLRVSELVRVRFEDLSLDTATLSTNTAKQREVVLDQVPVRPAVVDLVAAWSATSGRSSGWMFPGEKPDAHLSKRSAQAAFYAAAKRAGINIASRRPGERGLGIHSLRHCFAWELVELGYSELEIKTLLRDRSLQAATVYMGSSKEIEYVLKAGVMRAQCRGESYGTQFLPENERRPRASIRAEV